MKRYAWALSITLLSACTTLEKVAWVAVGGSKADGTVLLGIDVPPKLGIRETEVQWDADQANLEADRRCRSWGYSGAEAFQEPFPVQVTCYPQGISPCWSKAYRILYQCTGDRVLAPIAPSPSQAPPAKATPQERI